MCLVRHAHRGWTGHHAALCSCRPSAGQTYKEKRGRANCNGVSRPSGRRPSGQSRPSLPHQGRCLKSASCAGCNRPRSGPPTQPPSWPAVSGKSALCGRQRSIHSCHNNPLFSRIFVKQAMPRLRTMDRRCEELFNSYEGSREYIG
ncbi:hypothetical protein BDV59DRAFT_46998 [Aspergillus ambiguus]|uniref:uncharacterized protein n=1 Tax=Aspergillus ambiguus TaxID=176160 RepID=UPI003CCD93AD